MDDSKIKVLLYSHQSNLAGAPLCLVEIANNLSSKFDAFFTCPENGPTYEKVKTSKVILGHFFQKSKIIQLIKSKKINLVHANTLFGKVAVDAARHCNVPVIWQIHEDTSQLSQKQVQNIYTQATQIITVSKSMFKPFKELHDKAAFIYNGISLKPSTAKTHPTPLFVALGTIEPRKGFHTLIEAAALLRAQGLQFKIQIYGKALPTTRRYLKNLQKKIKQAQLEPFVEFKGVTSNIAKAMAPAWAVIVPSLSEPFGRVAVEAMALKKPVIASRVGGLSEIVVDRKTGFLFSTEDSTALAKKMALIIQDKRLVKELGTLAYKRYQERFTLKKHIQEIEKIYQSISLTD